MTRQTVRSARLVSVCLLGKKAIRVRQNRIRTEFALAVIRAMQAADWPPIDAIVFPGGYLRAKGFIGHQTHRERCWALANEGFWSGLKDVSKALERHSKGAVLAMGCDSAAPNSVEIGDQCCLALTAGKLVGLARKIFPAPLDTVGDYLPIVPALPDYSSRYRFVGLPNGQQAMLAACYDLFGLSEDRPKPGARSRHIRALWDDGRYFDGHQARRTREQAVSAWRGLLVAQRPRLALCAIHGFKRPGLDGFWQRHGIATASAALKGGLVVGAAHFAANLPKPEASTLASVRVPAWHIEAGLNRQARRLTPVDAFELHHAGLSALVRLFER
ncbi:hypothetical protein [Ferrovibrio sp.]|uniref:hypothetical protein n=1 Tax=Ferrovibrio sp. TaxID=1917215 RepID=UPI000CC93172|nr:hypothetical protein [Ferrovibrio sp.]PJI42210.1 MAG: hypothetical protein CTR53_07170 [Ferrovibrio sp.]